MQGITAFIETYATKADDLAAIDTDAAAKANYGTIASVCHHVSRPGARNIREAAQLFWFLHVLDETDSPGRIDQFFYPYYVMTSAAERDAEARVVFDELWCKFINNRTWNVCLGGQTPDGGDAVNELSHIFLDLQEKYGREAPNLSVRFFRGSPDSFVTRCSEVIGKGSGQPTMYNDEVLVPALVHLGIPIEDARNYAMNGCAQIDIQGKSHMGLEDGEVSLIKCLELALHRGKSPITGELVGADTLPSDKIDSYVALRDQLYAQIDHAVDLFTDTANLFQEIQAETCSQLFRSLFVDGCIQLGLDLKRGGPRYNHGQFQTEGIANCGNALYTIKKLVFEEGRYGLDELVDILDADWEGDENLHAEVKGVLPKYGNAEDDVDALTAQVLDDYFCSLSRKRTWRGGIYSGGVVVFNRAFQYGKGLAASADGRRSGEPVADSIGPTQGSDQNGPTAMLTSVAKLPFDKATCGACLNLKLVPSLFRNEEGATAVADLFSTYFALGAQQLQVNVVDRKTLVKAKENPEAAKSLVVRVGGYSDLFINLSPEYQDDIIARTGHTIS